ncbi:unnamed protein product [Clonostachys solani]|uniref:Zn(2)-C6 fungal-type domain-containing protein n=1 Tax=Clonostachys solani TaxID=160281 RepID=A0A9P0EGX5_9HYPO|nr:unnamed protein product [Clonostachys solani]
MFPQRQSCDRCRQQKVRCLKNWETSVTTSADSDYFSACERCTKADVPCVYSTKQRRRRSKGDDVTSLRRKADPSQGLAGMLTNRDVEGFDFNNLMALSTNVSCLGDSEAYSWINSLEGTTCQGDSADRTPEDPVTTGPTPSWEEGKETLTRQLLKLSNWAIDATHELESAVVPTPLVVGSSVLNEAYEATDTLVRILDSFSPANGTYRRWSRPLPRDESDPQQNPVISPVFLALASHQHILALFRALCDCIKRSLRSVARIPEPQQQSLHGAGSSSAQFTMVLQLMMHLLNRLGRGLRIGNRRDTDQGELMVEPGGDEEGGSLRGIVGSAQAMLKTLPEEHLKLGAVIQELQAHIEEGGHIQI